MSEKRKLSDETENDKEDAFKSSKQSKLCEAGSSTIDYDAPIKVQMSSNYLSKEFLANFSKFWHENESFSDSSVDLLASPFKLACLKDFLTDKDSLLQKLVQEMTEISFDRRQMDLYEFYQSTDLVNFESQPAMRMFYSHLRDTVMPWMEKLTGIKLSHISASCSMYNAGDYLLVHDDLMTDRRVAFVYYISPWKGAEKWTSEMGGALELFENREKEPLFPVKKRIPPTNNQFVFFRVGSDSFHQVGEVTNFDFPRLTINGWFHGPSGDDETATKIPQIDLHYTTPHEKTTDDALYELVNPIYLKTEYKEDIHKQIEENSEASLEEFLDEDFYDQILTQIQQIPADSWQLQGPANVRNYEVLTLNEKTPSIVAKFMEIFQSKAFFKLLHEYTELDLHGANVAEPKCSVELQRWTRGCYTVLGDPSQYADCTLDLIFYINAYPQVGVVTYLSPEEDSLDDEAGEEEEEIDPILLTIHPKDNALNLVYRNEGITKFTKYVSKNCLKEAIFRFSSTLTFIIVILVIGVPMWWKTTEVYRVPLPYTEISDLLKTPIKTKVNIGIFTHNEERTKSLIHDLILYFKEHEIVDLHFSSINLDKKLAEEAHSPAALENLAQKSVEVRDGDFMFIEWMKLTEEVLVNSGRAAFISSNATASKIQQVIRSWLLQEYRLKSILGSITTVSGQKLHHNTPPPQPQYDVLLSVLNPNPELQKLNWNVRLAAERYIEPYLKSLSPLSNFTIKSQWKYQVKFDHVDRQIPDNSKLKRHFMLHEDHLPQIITSLEKRLGNQVSSYPCVHLVFYMPPCKKGPLHIYKKNGERASTNDVDSFISAKWGGIVIVNPPEAVCEKFMENEEILTEVDVNSHDAMEKALFLLRKIFDMESNQPIKGVGMTEQETILPRNWEVDTYLRTGAIHLIHSAQSTLNSLIQLLGGISYIVINDQVGTEIKNSYAEVVAAKKCLAESDLKCAVTHARNAFIAAEAAFFDPSLLALLYFPDEQKYAIYIPLFLPIMIPVILSLSSIKKFFSKNSEETKTKEE